MIILYCFLFSSSLLGQINKYNQLLDSATKCAGLFTGIRPAINEKLDIRDTTFYKENLNESPLHKVDNKALVELIQNCKNADTTNWTDKEIKRSILVKNRDDLVSLKQVIAKFNLIDKKDIKLYRKQVNNFNNTNSWDKNISYFSRPIFDNSKKYAVIYFDNGHSGLNGGGHIDLFFFSNDNWQQIGTLTRWNY